MRNFCLLCIVFCLLTSQAFAMAPVNADNIKAAQEYGKQKAHSSSYEFLLPWISFEEKAVKLDESVEHAYLHTPFLMIATDSRERTLKGQTLKMADSEKIISDYAGYVVFSVLLYGNDPSFAEKLNAVLKQGENVLQAQTVMTSVEPVTANATKGRLYSAQCYIYFLQKDVQEKPVMLLVTPRGSKERSFFFDLPKIK